MALSIVQGRAPPADLLPVSVHMSSAGVTAGVVAASVVFIMTDAVCGATANVAAATTDVAGTYLGAAAAAAARSVGGASAGVVVLAATQFATARTSDTMRRSSRVMAVVAGAAAGIFTTLVVTAVETGIRAAIDHYPAVVRYITARFSRRDAPDAIEDDWELVDGALQLPKARRGGKRRFEPPLDFCAEALADVPPPPTAPLAACVVPLDPLSDDEGVARPAT